MRFLDVGSGTDSPYHLFLKGSNVIHIDICKHAFHVEVVADAHYLPFSEDVFDIVHASHILEHVENPYKVVGELKRVSKRRVIVKVPNEVCYGKFKCSGKGHIYGWNVFTFRNLLERHFSTVQILRKNRIAPKKKFEKLKVLLLNLLTRERNELIAVCETESGKSRGKH